MPCTLRRVTLKATATNLVFADGNPKARLMLIGEAPGQKKIGADCLRRSDGQLLTACWRDPISTSSIQHRKLATPATASQPGRNDACLPYRATHSADQSRHRASGDTAAKTLTNRNEHHTSSRQMVHFGPNRLNRRDTSSADIHPAYLLARRAKAGGLADLLR